MRRVLLTTLACFVFTLNTINAQNTSNTSGNQKIAELVDSFYEQNERLYPVYATFNGDNRYNHLLNIDFTDSFRDSTKGIYQQFLASLNKIDRPGLNQNDQLNYDVLKWELETNLEGLALNDNVFVFHQMDGLPSLLPLLGSGSVVQPFLTVQDYDNWLRRASAFPAWSDSAIVYFKKGIQQNMTFPKAVVEKMIPQLAAQVSADVTKSSFYGPINQLPSHFSAGDKQRLTEAYTKLIKDKLNPSFQKLHDFLKKEYLPKARSTSGVGSLPGGKKIYDYYIRYFTTTNKSADEIYNIGLAEVKRIQNEMQKVKESVGYKGDLKAFFAHMRTEPKLYPYKTPEEILNFYRNIEQRIAPVLKTMFHNTPKTPFEVRQTEAFRAASAAAQYTGGSLENKRPGIFYVPIVDPAKTQTWESLFLHEAIPGHHYQISLQNENTNLPKFRRFGGNAAYIEGWGLYAESLGKELGMYKDPYQYMLMLGSEIHRAIRLVVDAGLHAKGWTREQAIKYSLDNEPIEEQRAVSEIERYMVMPGQALAYKIGELKIKELRSRYTKQLGKDFDLAAFHDAILKDGSLPLEVLERNMDRWAKEQQRNM